MTFFHVLSLFSLLIWTDAVNKDDFHTCSQSPFCLRQRSSDKLSEFACDPSTVRSSSSSSVTFSAIDKLSNSSVDVSVSAFKHGIYRLSVVDPSVIQFELPKVLSEEYEGAGVPLRIVKRSNRQLELKCASCNDSVRVRCRPNLIVEVLDSDHEVLMSFNSKNRMYMEGDRRSIGGDVSFLGFDRVYGIPEHADSHALKSTTGKSDSEPYRLFNLDVFEYELDSQMALYGSIPVMYAHSINRPRTVGVFWMNAAEAWIDVDLGNANNRGKTSMVVNRAIHSISEWMRHLFRQKNQQQNESTKRESNISTHWMFDGGNIDLFFMTGSERPIDVIRQYMFLTGTAKLPPLSTLGYHQSRWSYMSQKEVMDLERNFDRLKIPLDHVWLDIDYTDGVKYFK